LARWKDAEMAVAMFDDRMAGWYYEAPDYSVGLFGGGWVHECEVDGEAEGTDERFLSSGKGSKEYVIESLYLLTCLDCGQQRIVVDTDIDADAMFEAEQNDKARKFGMETGRAAGSWVIDGNTTVERCGRIIDGFNEVDPAIMELEPSPLSGEHSGELTPLDVLQHCGADGDLEEYQDLIDSFEDGFSEGFWDTVIAAARYQVTGKTDNNEETK
jgi:hypothetical protein